MQSPGINENEKLTGMVLDYLPRTAAVICVVNASQGATQSLRTLLARARQAESYNPRQIFWVFSHWDQIAENEREEVNEKLLYDLKSVMPDLIEENIVKMDLKLAFTAAQHKVENQEYNKLIGKLIPFLKIIFKINLQKGWNVLKEILTYNSNLIKAVHKKTGKKMNESKVTATVLLNELETMEKMGDKVFKGFAEKVKSKTDSLRNLLCEAVNEVNFKRKILENILHLDLDLEKPTKEIQVMVMKKICEDIVKETLDSEVVRGATKKVLDQVFNDANKLFGKILFDLKTFENSLTGNILPEKDDKGLQKRRNLKLKSDSDVTSGETFSANVWAPIGLVAGVLALPVFGIHSLYKKIQGNYEKKQIKQDPQKWKQKVFDKWWCNENVNLVLRAVVSKSFESVTQSSLKIIQHVKYRMEATKQVLWNMEKMRDKLKEFRMRFSVLRKEIEFVSESLYRFYLMEIKVFQIKESDIQFQIDKQGKVVQIGRGEHNLFLFCARFRSHFVFSKKRIFWNSLFGKIS